MWNVIGLTVAMMVATGLASSLPAVAQTRQEQGQPQQRRAAPLPPALQAAIATGTLEAVRQAITTLAGGNFELAGQLAVLAIQAAERMLSTNPQGAVQVATGAVATIRNADVQQASRQNSETVITTAARIFINPGAERVAPEASAQLAMSSMQAASTMNNNALSVQVADQAVRTAERVLAGAPAAAVEIAGMAMATAKQETAMSQTPAASLQIAATSARIIIRPEAQQSSPQMVASIASSTVQVVSNQAVYQSSPQGAINVMADAYAASNNQTVIAATPTVTATVRALLQTASQTQTLSAANAANASSIDAILAGKTPETPKTSDQNSTNVNANQNGENANNNASPS